MTTIHRHALMLRQAKLSFPSPVAETPTVPATLRDLSSISGVYLLAGVHSDTQCLEHKARTVMSHAERCGSVRHCVWVDEVVPDAPWIIDQKFLDKVRFTRESTCARSHLKTCPLQYAIDYVAHDEDPYGSAGLDDVYAYCKSQGEFLSPVI